MAWLPTAAVNATEGKMIRTPVGNAVFFSGAFYVLQTPLTAITANTATSLFSNDTTAVAGVYPVVNLGNPPFAQYPGSTRVIPPGALAPGTLFNGDFEGVGTFTANNLTLTLGLVGPSPATTYTVISTTGAVAASAFGAGAYFHINFTLSVTTVGVTGSITGAIGIEYGPTLIAIQGPLVATTFDTTQQYSIDMRATWSGGANSLQLAFGAIEVIG
jgi:hypothetical protein